MRSKLLIVAGVALFLMSAVVGWFISMHPEISAWLVIGLAIIAVIVVLYFVSWMSSKIAGHWANHAALRAEAKQYQLEMEDQERERLERAAARQREWDRLEWERQRKQIAEDRAWQLQQERVRLEREKLQADQQARLLELQAIKLKNNEVLAMRRGDYVDIAYMPPNRQLERLVEQDTIEGQQVYPEIAAPRTVPTARELLTRGDVWPNQGDVLVGYTRDGKPYKQLQKRMKAMFICGLQAGGKSTTANWILAQHLLNGGRFALVDKHANTEEDSLYARLKVYEPLMTTPVGDSPQASLRVLKHAMKLLNDRLAGAPCPFPFYLVTDEFTAIMRYLDSKDSAWYPVAVALAEVYEAFSTEGRKVGCYPIAIGQAPQGSRTGSTVIRDTMNTFISHRLRNKQAGLLGLAEESDEIERLQPGHICFASEVDEPTFLIVPLMTEQDNLIVASLLGLERKSNPKSTWSAPKTDEVNQGFTARSTDVHLDTVVVPEPMPEPPVNPSSERREPSPEDRSARVLKLKGEGVNKEAIILEIWGAKKGGNQAWKEASEQYNKIIEMALHSQSN